MRTFRRRKVFVDRKVQGALLLRCLLQWFVCLQVFVAAVVIIKLGQMPHGIVVGELWWDIYPILIAAVFVLPILLIDNVRLTHKFVGPLWRVRRGLRDLAAGRAVKPITFRKGDFWFEVADEFNAVVAKMDRHLESDEDRRPFEIENISEPLPDSLAGREPCVTGDYCSNGTDVTSLLAVLPSDEPGAGGLPRRGASERRGVAAVEFAVIAPLLFLLLFGMIDVGRAMMVQNMLTSAARDGARAASLDGATAGEVKTMVETFLANSKVPGATATVTPNPLSLAAIGDPVTVNVAVPYSSVSWLPVSVFLGGATLDATIIMRREVNQ